MSHSHRPRMSLLRALVVALPALGLLGCNFILNPENSDDILRCGNAIDCERFDEIAAAIANNRVQAKCDAPSGDNMGDISQANENQVCSVVDKEVSCAMASYGGDEEAGSSSPQNDYVAAFTEAVSRINLYVGCSTENFGKRGCKPMNGLCEGGMLVNDYGVCDDAAAEIPAVEANPELKGQDVRDQFCRSYFCSEEFACVADGKNYACRRCEPGKPLGEGGCGDIWFNGARSTVYIEDECPSSSAVTKAAFGPVPPSPMP